MFNKKEKPYTFVTQREPYQYMGKTEFSETVISNARFEKPEQAMDAAELLMKIEKKIQFAYVIKIEGKFSRWEAIVYNKEGDKNP